ncbi:MAG: hypothetical protein SPL10_03060 [Synergistales bacterium]|nr:hypothetical protein [Synergistales bacterium]MDY6401446.1 hypothetical protein [Synergistales bacterium]MDY6404080.1 hypothetical protein [Synergistales bacterium]MDY6410003.1 hypothetical protein [Synergistales bacterium]MDY6414121.1 hypothetical protein [Synergistales bacterium]
MPLFASGDFVLFAQVNSPDFYTAVSLVYMSRVSHDEPLVKIITSKEIFYKNRIRKQEEKTPAS